MLAIADLMNSRNPDGTYADNSADAINAINSLDYEPEGTQRAMDRARPPP